MNIREIITKMGFGNQAVITAFKHEDDDSDYAVWKIEDGNVIRVLKKTSKQELDIYDTFLYQNKCILFLTNRIILLSFSAKLITIF